MINHSFENPCLGRLIAGAIPRGSIHLGELTGALEHWVDLQEHYECIFVISDLGSRGLWEISSETKKQDIYEILADWLAVGISPNNSIIVLESDIPGIFELAELLQDSTVPDYENWEENFSKSPDLTEALEILLFKADTIPLTIGQPENGLEKARGLGTSYNRKYGEVFPIIKPHNIKDEHLLGIDGCPMRRSLGNLILLKELDKETEQKINSAPINTLIRYAIRFDPDQNRAQGMVENFYAETLSEPDLRKHVSVLLGEHLHSARVKRDKWIANPDELEAILKVGARRACAIAMDTLSEVKARVDLALT